eukprot:scaffold233175_cov37-Tisochrysis_lutea.AAC.4
MKSRESASASLPDASASINGSAWHRSGAPTERHSRATGADEAGMTSESTWSTKIDDRMGALDRTSLYLPAAALAIE